MESAAADAPGHHVPDIDFSQLDAVVPHVTSQLQNFCTLALEQIKVYKPEIVRLDLKFADVDKQLVLVHVEVQQTQNEARQHQQLNLSRFEGLEERIARTEALLAGLPAWKEDLGSRIDTLSSESKVKIEAVTVKAGLLEDTLMRSVQSTRERLDTLTSLARTAGESRQQLSDRLDGLEKDVRHLDTAHAIRLNELDMAQKRANESLSSADRKITEASLQLGVMRIELDATKEHAKVHDTMLDTLKRDLDDANSYAGSLSRSVDAAKKALSDLDATQSRTDQALQSLDQRVAQDTLHLQEDMQGLAAFRDHVTGYLEMNDRKMVGLDGKLEILEAKCEAGPPTLWKMASQVAQHTEELAFARQQVEGHAEALRWLESAALETKSSLSQHAQEHQLLADGDKQLADRLAAESARLQQYTEDCLLTVARKYEVEAVSQAVADVRSDMAAGLAAVAEGQVPQLPRMQQPSSESKALVAVSQDLDRMRTSIAHIQKQLVELSVKMASAQQTAHKDGGQLPATNITNHTSSCDDESPPAPLSLFFAASQASPPILSLSHQPSLSSPMHSPSESGPPSSPTAKPPPISIASSPASSFKPPKPPSPSRPTSSHAPSQPLNSATSAGITTLARLNSCAQQAGNEPSINRVIHASLSNASAISHITRTSSVMPPHESDPEVAHVEINGITHDLMKAMHHELRRTRAGPLPDASDPASEAAHAAAVARLQAAPPEVQSHVRLLEKVKAQLDRLVSKCSASTTDFACMCLMMLGIKVKLVEDCVEGHAEDIGMLFQNLESVFDYLGRLQEAVNSRAGVGQLQVVEEALKEVARQLIAIEPAVPALGQAAQRLLASEAWQSLSSLPSSTMQDSKAVPPNDRARSASLGTSHANPTSPKAGQGSIASTGAAMQQLLQQRPRLSTQGTGRAGSQSPMGTASMSQPNLLLLNSPSTDGSVQAAQSSSPKSPPTYNHSPSFPPPSFHKAHRDILSEQERKIAAEGGLPASLTLNLNATTNTRPSSPPLTSPSGSSSPLASSRKLQPTFQSRPSTATSGIKAPTTAAVNALLSNPGVAVRVAQQSQSGQRPRSGHPSNFPVLVGERKALEVKSVSMKSPSS